MVAMSHPKLPEISDTLVQEIHYKGNYRPHALTACRLDTKDLFKCKNVIKGSKDVLERFFEDAVQNGSTEALRTIISNFASINNQPQRGVLDYFPTNLDVATFVF